ncbi:hypothetical protein [Massilia aquatica]|uniref:Uncharacterized protein n=1 Tax=Massilia aquatica TaxID=2609000 RepID=A0ABX0M6H9_9BURK|nr:hypothetical protein [Massilia aquatica]NHZ42836.1 hypothetical protein [Massilia aquatica]
MLETKVDGRLASIELTLESGLSSLKTNMDAQFARFEASLHKSQADTLKWLVGIVLLLGTIGLAIMTFLFNKVPPKAPSAMPLIVITIPTAPHSMPGDSPASSTSHTPDERH